MYRTNAHISHFIPQNYIRWNFNKRTAGESAGKVGTEQINSNEHHRQEIIKSICPSKQPQSLQKYSSKIRNTASSKPDHQYTNQTIIHPSSHPPWGAHLGRANAPGPGRSEDQARQDETILHDWHGAKKVVILSCQKSANPSRLRRKNLSRNEK